MAQIPRPFQLALVVVVLLAGVWLFALQPHSNSPSTTSSTSTPVVTSTVSTGSTSAAHSRSASAKPSTSATHPAAGAHHSSVPGLQGLTRDVAKAREAAATPQREAREVQAKAAAGTSEAPSQAPSGAHTSVSPTHQSSTAAPSTTTAAAHGSATTITTTTAHPSTSASAHARTSTPPRTASTSVKAQPVKSHLNSARTPANQVLVEQALKGGKIAVILFWNPKGADDTVDAVELQRLQAIHHLVAPYAKVPGVRRVLEKSGEELTKNFAIFKATASQVTSYGTITAGLQIYSTPTLLVINKQGKTIVLTGLQDAFSIEQAIDEARAA
ncbi:MAG TPA: hypothetical protein VMD79_09320 [Solirubrobacteraceae bacterium]|nr:hypothetical protein [Solirubrobacteraceae bacterium]